MKKVGKIRRIDQGTRYDVTGLLRRWTRAIERGEHGEITDLVLVAHQKNGNVKGFHAGPGSVERAHFMLSTAKNRLEPA